MTVPGPPAPSVVALHASTANRVPLTTLARATVAENSGLQGDRHAKPGNRRALLLMAVEDLHRFGLAPGEVREQVTLQGVDLPALASGTRLSIGEAVLEVGAPCAPCERIDELRAGLAAEMDGRRGRFARVVRGGAIAVGDLIVLEPPA